MTYWLDKLLKNQKKIPFDIKKKFVVVGRGRENKERLIFNLNLVNVFYLNYEPVEWIMNYYRAKYPAVWEKSLFSFRHGTHYRELCNIYRKNTIPVISWKEKPESILTNNVSIACLDWLSGLKKKGAIYITAFDMGDEVQWFYKLNKGGKKEWWQQSRDWTQEVRHINGLLKKHVGINFQFLTYNKYFGKDGESQCAQLREKLIKKKAIIIELSLTDIDRIYEETGNERQREPGEVMREMEGKS